MHSVAQCEKRKRDLRSRISAVIGCALAAAVGTLACGGGDVASETYAQTQQALNSVSYVSGNVWYVDGAPWLMKGVNWDPSEPCEWHTQYNWSRAAGDAAIMQDNGFNTIRTFGFTSAKEGLPENGFITTAQLDQFYNRGIRVILTVHAAPGDSTWTGAGFSGPNILPATGDFTSAAKTRITALANHPAVIALSVGNEIRYNFFYTTDPGGAWSNGWTVNNIVQHANHVTNRVRPLTNKPVVVSWGNTWDINRVAELNADIISYQIYNNLVLDNIFNLHPQHSGKPFFMSEFGADAWNANINAVDQAAQSHGNRTLFQQILDNATTGAHGTANHKIVGGTVFSFSDGWWKAGLPCTQESGGIAPGGGPYPDLTFNEEYWGLCLGDGAVTRTCRQTITTLKNLFANYSATPPPPPPPAGRSIADNLRADSNDGQHNVQFENTTDVGGGQNAGWIANGSWIEWQINVPSTGTYTVTTRSASTAQSTYQIRVNGSTVTSNTIPSTGGWQNWQSFTTNSFTMNAGTRTLRIHFTSANQNLNWVKVNAGASCTPTTCAAQGANCGSISNGCGGTLNCGSCSGGQTCNNNVCAASCTPTTCAAQGKNCGTIANGCGGNLNCGSCSGGQTCTENVCTASCTPTTCQAQGKNCGSINDGCGGTIQCGNCASPQTCGGGGTANVCGGGGGGGGGCSGLSGWQQISYAPGAQITEGGRRYECKEWPFSGWCGSGTAYKPTSGFAWADAWYDRGACQ